MHTVKDLQGPINTVICIPRPNLKPKVQPKGTQIK